MSDILYLDCDRQVGFRHLDVLSGTYKTYPRPQNWTNKKQFWIIEPKQCIIRLSSEDSVDIMTVCCLLYIPAAKARDLFWTYERIWYELNFGWTVFLGGASSCSKFWILLHPPETVSRMNLWSVGLKNVRRMNAVSGVFGNMHGPSRDGYETAQQCLLTNQKMTDIIILLTSTGHWIWEIML